jgi:hypothetical protein
MISLEVVAANRFVIPTAKNGQEQAMKNPKFKTPKLEESSYFDGALTGMPRE